MIAAVGHCSDSAWPVLDGVRTDAERLGNVLEAHTDRPIARLFRVCDNDATRTEILERIEQVVRLAEARSQIFVLLAGHGAIEKGDGGRAEYFFVPWDAKPGDIRATCVSTRDIAAILGKAKAKEIVVILDFCHSGGMPGFAWIEPILARADRACCIMAAAHCTEAAGEHEGGGYLTGALTNAFEGKGLPIEPGGRVSAQKAWSYAAELVRDEASRDGIHQNPVAYTCGPPIYVTRPVRPLDGSTNRIVRVYPTSLSEEFHNDVRRLITTSRRILFVGTGLSILNDAATREALVERARVRDVAIDICLANPYNPSVQDRLIEEEMRDQPPFIGRSMLRERFVQLVENIQKLDRLKRINVRLFEHYPKVAILILDNNIFFYPYGYHVLGTTSPVTWLRDDGGADARFYRKNAELICQDSVPASMVVKALGKPGYCDTSWTLAAVHIIPDPQSALYRYGSAMIGYDIHRQRRVPVTRCPVRGFRDAVGGTAAYGFHVTLADALYFATESAIDRVKAELLFLSREFRRFDLAGIRLVYPFHDNRRMMVLQCRDPDGWAEALHHEVVSRIYRLAISSIYRTRRESRAKAKIDRRFRLMLQRYGAPYILREYDPHFTLASNCPADEAIANELAQHADAEFRARVRRPAFRVRELVLAVKRHGDEYWQIEKRFPLQS